MLTVPGVNMPGGGIVSPDPDATPARLIRVTALAWADVVLDQLAHTEVSDGLTGLSSPAYLRARLREVYREATAEGVRAADKYVLVCCSPDVCATSGWSRLAAMVLLADSLRAVYDGGQTLAAIGPPPSACSPNATAAAPPASPNCAGPRLPGSPSTRSSPRSARPRSGWRNSRPPMRPPAGSSPSWPGVDAGPRRAGVLSRGSRQPDPR